MVDQSDEGKDPLKFHKGDYVTHTIVKTKLAFVVHFFSSKKVGVYVSCLFIVGK